MTDEGTILIVSSRGDAHVEDVIKEILTQTDDVVLLNSDDVPGKLTVDFSCGDTAARPWRWSLSFRDDCQLDGASIRSVWWRKPGHYYGLSPELSPQEREFAKGELDHLFGSVWSLLDTYWMNHPERNRAAGWKLEQLVRARRQGVAVPRTLVSNSPDEVRAFYDECCGRMVFKVMTDPLLGAVTLSEKQPDVRIEEVKETTTTPIGPAQLEEIDSVRLLPGLFQEYVPKRFEYRVTVIGDELFAARIDSQAREGTRHDWRNWADGGLEIPYARAELPGEIEDFCRQLVSDYGLNFGALDFVETPDGQFVFLELNPTGQFIWVEKRLPELRMTSALASALVSGGSATAGMALAHKQGAL